MPGSVLLASTLAVLVIVCHASEHTNWSYGGSDGPAYWFKNYPKCGGKVQSPIDIVPGNANHDTKLSLTYSGYDKAPSDESMTITNNGHSVKMILNDYKPGISGYGLPEKYIAEQFHFHWGTSNSKGSEHTVDGGRFPLEMHIVHYRESKGSVHAAADKAQGLAVLSCLFKVTTEDNPAFDSIIKKLSSITHKDKTAPVTAFPLESLLPTPRSRFYRYGGSLTTPPCYESVIWTIFHDKCSISSNQLSKFRTLYATATGSQHPLRIENNFRPIQATSGRTISSSFNTQELNSAESSSEERVVREEDAMGVDSLLSEENQQDTYGSNVLSQDEAVKE